MTCYIILGGLRLPLQRAPGGESDQAAGAEGAAHHARLGAGLQGPRQKKT